MKYDQSIQKSALLGGLATEFVTMSESEAVQIARTHFGIEGSATRFAAEKDDTFRISSTGGSRYILKAANPAEDLSAIDLQLCVLTHLAARSASLPVPGVISSARGEQQFEYRDRAGQHRRIWMLTYLEGQPLSEVRSTAAGREQIGKVLARLRLALADFYHPHDSRVIAWDIKHLLSLECLLGEVADAGRRKRLEAGLARFTSIERHLAQSRSQVLHNDFSTSNIVVDLSTSDFVSGVIDFGDVVRTSIAIDVSTALLSQLPTEPVEGDIFANGRDLLNGYIAAADLTAQELSIIPHLVMGRIVAKSLLSTWLANSVPSNAAYFLRNTKQGWHQLEWFLSRSEAEVSEQFLNLVM
ncbi:phosphotransferase [Bradyrhizobium sp. WSM3983]|uniref:phosphotransferase n=1 Tax=Bradyrhizobium sp. WSM3983 TaxID=1038867 RepID=UPI0003F5F677|nr:phosphotransferase [Bradyrhizobium sp. WSM3983]